MTVASQRTREIRLGLVMYGGVSLAIYINGVGTEFFNAVRGRGVYRLLKSVTDSDIVVDIISGTSAGGINGVLLAYALCNGLEFSATAKLWRELGDIGALLRSPHDEDDVRSLLNGDYYERGLEAAFRDMPPCAVRGEDVSAFAELDLFVTGTDVDGDIYTVFDDQGHAVDVKDHRRVFQLKHRDGRKTPFSNNPPNPGLHPSLAKLCRITSSFPVAFQPALVGAESAADAVDRNLRLWGSLPGRECAFMDGGVLDNKPFSCTTKAIFTRLSERRVQRKLFYVEPDPEHFPVIQHARRLDVVQAALAALVGIPGYESIADDLKLISDRNSKINAYNRLETMVKRRTSDAQSVAAVDNLETYRSLRVIAISEQVVQRILKEDGQRVKLGPEATRVAQSLYAWLDSRSGAQMATNSRLLENFDVYFRMRRLFNAIYSFYDATVGNDNDPDADTPAARLALTRLNHFVQRLEIIRSAMEALLDRTPFEHDPPDPGLIWRKVETLLARLLDAAGPDHSLRAGSAAPVFAPLESPRATPESLVELNAMLNERLDLLSKLKSDEVMSAGIDKAEGHKDFFDGFRSILLVTDEQERAYIEALGAGGAPGGPQIRSAYVDFERVDAELYALQYANGLFEKDIIQTIRISPRDAQAGFSKRDAADKVCGDEAAHFSGFFKKSWRSNDILWGRLDASCQLIETFLDPTCIRDHPNPLLREQIDKGDIDLRGMFPRSTPERCAAIRTWLLGLASDDAAERTAARAEFKAMREVLIEAAQLEILDTGVPAVIEDAITEQNAWNQFSTADGYTTGKGTRSSLVSAAAAAEAADREIAVLKDPANGPEKLQKFFVESYDVGRETMARDVPLLVLLEILARSLLVTRNALLTVFGKRAEAVRAHWASRVLGGFLWSFYGIVSLMRRSTCARQLFVLMLLGVVMLVTLATLQLVSGSICANQHTALWYRVICDAEDGTLKWTYLAAVVLAALAALLLVRMAAEWTMAAARRWLSTRFGLGPRSARDPETDRPSRPIT